MNDIVVLIAENFFYSIVKLHIKKMLLPSLRLHFVMIYTINKIDLLVPTSDVSRQKFWRVPQQLLWSGARGDPVDLHRKNIVYKM